MTDTYYSPMMGYSDRDPRPIAHSLGRPHRSIEAACYAIRRAHAAWAERDPHGCPHPDHTWVEVRENGTAPSCPLVVSGYGLDRQLDAHAPARDEVTGR